MGNVYKALAQLLILYCITPPLNAVVNSPKIISKDGHLIFESGLDRNISFILKGKSRLNINNEYDVIDMLLQSKKGRISGPPGSPTVSDWSEEEEAAIKQLMSDVTSLKTQVFGPNGMESRFRNLQNRTRTASVLLRRYKSRMTRVETRVQNLQDRLEIDNCRGSPCQNGGSCLNMFGSYVCKCQKSFEGISCEKDVNECALYAGTDLGCQNGAQCINQFGAYSCICQPGWFGIHCTQRKGDCLQSSAWELCGHGTCVSSNDTFGYKCICDQGWKTNGLTPACSVDVDECAESHTACVTKCINLPGSFTCGPCAVGLTGNGINCRDIDECSQQNGGCSLSPRVACINTYGSYHCGECPLGWSGDGRSCVRTTNTNTDTSSSDMGSVTTCANSNICHPQARCHEISHTVVCSCPSGMVGSGIGPNGCVVGTANNCINQPCKNGGTCVDNGGGFNCICPVGFIGATCLPVPSPCTPNPCRHNGRCRPITTSTNLSFTCQCTAGFVGPKCERQANDCGGVLQDLTGTLKYPIGSLYDHNSQCAWILRTNESLVLNVTFHNFDLEDSTECRFDWLQINDGRSAASQIIGRFCGAHKPLGGNIISSTNNLYLWFRSDNSSSKEGFELEWSSIQPQCGGVVSVTTHGTISSPGSPGNYPKNRDCHWLLKAPNDKRLKLTFFSMQIEVHDSCNFDFVEVSDAVSGDILEKYCNSSHPQPLLLPTNEANIHFHSDNIASDSGFQIFYSVEERIPGCGGTYTASKGTIQSPFTNQESISCEYEILLEASKSVVMEFQTFKMGPQDCMEIYDVNAADNSRALQAKYCGDYEIMPPVIYSQYNHVVLKYYAKMGAEFKLQYKSDCSYTFTAAEGLVQAPYYPEPKNFEYLCTFKILAEPNTVIAVHFDDFDMYDTRSAGDKDCTYSSLTINDDMDKNIMGPFCGQYAPDVDFVSKTNGLMFQAKKSAASKGKGFKLTYKSVAVGKTDCGGVYTKPGYSIKLPTDDSGQYMHDMKCYWIIIAPKDKFILLNWKYFKLEESADCSYDYVEIYDNPGDTENNAALGRYCDAHKPESFLSHARMLTVKFVSDSTDSMDGFEFTYEFIDGTNQCNGNIHSSTGKLNTPNWPGNYTEDMDCTYVINTPPGTQLELQVEIFDLEYDEDCASDWLEIRNGGSNRSSLIGRFCGNYSKIPHSIPSFSNQMYLRFHSNSFVGRRGFQIRWFVFSNGCGGNLQSDRGVITSPYYPDSYTNNAQCEWRIHVHPGSQIHIKIDDLAIETHGSCRYDKLELYEGTAETKHHLVTLCHLETEEMGKEYIIDSNEALVVFETDDTNRDRGFSISYRSNCSVLLTKPYGRIQSPNFDMPLSDYSEEVDCTWTIRAPRGNHIQLEFIELTSKGKLYVKDSYRPVQIPEVGNLFNSTFDTVIIRQNSSDVSFELEYVMVGCMETLRKATGNFVSPNYPNSYFNDIECQWEIVTQPGQGIELTIKNLDLEESVNCTKDALVISSHLHSKNVKERHCGKRESLVITSSSHKLYVKFYSDYKGNGKGFEASYTTQKEKCGGVISSKSGVITSPNYPNNYPENSDCEWTVKVADHHVIIFTMEELELEDFYECEMDYVEAFEEIGDAAPLQLFKDCGDIDGKENTTWRSTSNTATVRFHSDDSVSTRGFKLSFVEDCGGRVEIEEQNLMYVDIVSSAPANKTCEWQLISKDPSKHILLSFSHIQMNPNLAYTYRTEGDCIQKGAVIYDGSDDTAPVKSRFCKSHPPDIISNGHALTVKVPMSIISEISAIAYQMDSFCGGSYKSLTGKFSSPYYPSSYPLNMQCTWMITASQGNRMQVTFESMDLEDSDNCNNDYVEVRQDSDLGPLLGLFCGKQVPPTIQGSDMLLVLFQSNEDIVGEGFLATYSYVMHNELNGTSGVIESPAYPAKFHSHDMYSWRITVPKDYVVSVSVKHIVDVDKPYIKFYDGYSDIGAHVHYYNDFIAHTHTNILYVTAYRGPFQFEWQQLSKESVRSNRTAEKIAKLCGTQTLRVNSTFIFNSPGYPIGYEPNLKCAWTIVPNDPSKHVDLTFLKLDLEEFDDCFADYVQVSSSKDLQNWKTFDKLCKKPSSVQSYAGTPYLKLEFITDSGVNKTGFNTLISTKCGSELTDRHGFVNITADKNNMASYSTECIWSIKVRQGKRIRLKFPDSLLHGPTGAGACQTYFLVRNGIADDSPFLGKGKYCENDISDVLETSSNRAYIKFSRIGFPGFRASFYYEEIINECSRTVTLSDSSKFDQVQTIQSPNYPNIPNPHSECIWKVIAPIHKTITLDFFGDFDLKVDGSSASEECELEYLKINDGATENAPEVGKYCGKTKPNSIRSTGNIMRLLYYTDVSEPHKGFQANLSISRCGGFFYEAEGVVKSPTSLKLKPNEKELECVFTVETELGTTMNISLDHMHLGEIIEGEQCSDVTHIELQEVDAFTTGFDNITDTLFLCGETTSRYIVETNKMVLRYKIRHGNHNPDAFQISYSTIGSRCGETIEAFAGILQTPNYPMGNTLPTLCSWHIKVPKGRRIRAEFLDFDMGDDEAMGRTYRRILFTNDKKMTSVITRISNSPPAVIYSTDNTMSIDVLLLSFKKGRGFKLKFSGHEFSSHCRSGFYYNAFSVSQTLTFERDNETSVYCSYNLRYYKNKTIVVHVVKESKYPQQDWLPYGCQYFTPLQLYTGEERLLPTLLCRNETQPSFRLPFAATLVVNGNTRNSLQELQLKYEYYNCGGVFSMKYYDELTITEPNYLGDPSRFECAWAVWASYASADPPSFEDILSDMQMEISLSTDFKGTCEEEYLIVYNGPNQNSPHLGRYCSQSSIKNIVVTGGVYAEFITEKVNMLSKFNLTVREGSGCGGTLDYPYRQVMFDYQYKNNVECIWDLKTEVGFHLAAVFVGRFFIEASTNCTKDYLKIQQKNANEEWEDLQTLCGRTPPMMVNTTSTEMRLIFRSDGDVVGDGFTANFERNCGGILYASDEMQQISSPGFPDGYPHDIVCNYTILPNPEMNKTETDDLYIRFIDFEVEDAPTMNCLFDNVTITTQDNAGNAVNKVLCGRKQNYEVRSKSKIDVVLRTDVSYASKGFLMEYGHNKCGAVVNKSAIIESPKESSSQMYPDGSKCSWQLQAPPNHKIIIKFEMLDFEAQGMCTYDAVEVYKGLNVVEDQRLGKFCGNLTGKIPSITISQNTALIYSYSDARDPSRGFKALVGFIPDCDKQIYLHSSNNTYEFNRFSGEYANNLDCSWLFTTSPDRQLQMEFSTFHLESSTNCIDDYLEVRDGPGLFSDLMGRFCGHDLPSPMVSSRHSALLRFVSDDKGTSSGFSVKIRSVAKVCGQHLLDLTTTKTVTIVSPDDGTGKYPNNINCVWKIKSDNNIHLKFEKLQIEGPDVNYYCSADYVKIINSDDTDLIEKGYSSKIIFNGQDKVPPGFNYNVDFGSEHVFCGQRVPDDYFSSSKSVFVKFKSDMNFTMAGFKLTATAADGCFRNFTGSQGRIQLAQSKDYCDIYIKSPVNTTLSLYYSDVMFSEFDCEHEYVEVFDARTNTSLQKVCEYIETGKSLFSTTNELRLRLKLSGFYTQFDLTYLASTEGPGCGGYLYNTAGIITNPFYPNNVRQNSDCLWHIRVPSNMKVMLRFYSFNMGAKSTCHSDYVQFIEYFTEDVNTDVVGAKTTRQYCGEDEPGPYRSEVSLVTVRFRKTVNYDGTGWVLQFTAVSPGSDFM